VLAACGSTGPSTPRPTVAAPATAGSPTNVPDGSSPSAQPGASQPTTTEIAWGRIWDELPPGFPHYPGAEPAETGGGPASATLAVPASASTAADWYRGALTRAGYDTKALSGPLEDGSVVIDSVGGGDPDCRVQTSLVPHGNQAIATILFAAACPFH
jgi:hypothetical protein